MRMNCLYAIVRFTPYSETNEFANVGILVCVPDAGYFNFKLAPAKFKRIPAFFEDLNNKLYAATRNSLENELLRIKSISNSGSPSQLYNTFNEIVRSRENIIRFGDVRSALIKTSPEEYMNALFNKFVGRDFITAERRTHEEKIVKNIKHKFKLEHLPTYKEDKIYSELIEAKFPLVNKDNGYKIIKPLSFQHETPTKVIEHGERWHWRIKRLIQSGSLIQNNILMPFEAPKTKDKLLIRAYEEVVAEFQELRVGVCDFNDNNTLINFARKELLSKEFKLV